MKKISELHIQQICEKLNKLQPEQLENELVTLLKEPKRYVIHSVVRNIPKDIILEVVAMTIEIQCSGGMLITGDDQKKKTPGGVFLTLLKKSEKVTKDQLKKITKCDKERWKEKRKTMRLIDALNIDRIKVPKEMMAQPQESMTTDENTTENNMLE